MCYGCQLHLNQLLFLFHTMSPGLLITKNVLCNIVHHLNGQIWTTPVHLSTASNAMFKLYNLLRALVLQVHFRVCTV